MYREKNKILNPWGSVDPLASLNDAPDNVPVTKSMAPKRLAPKSPKLIHGYTPLIDPAAWLRTMGKMRMSFASTPVFYPLPHPQIRTSAFYHRPSCTRISLSTLFSRILRVKNDKTKSARPTCPCVTRLPPLLAVNP